MKPRDKLNSYVTYRNVITGMRKVNVGASNCISNSLKSDLSPLNTNLQAVGVCVHNKHLTTIYSIYLSLNQIAQQNHLDNVFLQLTRLCNTAGDFNAHSQIRCNHNSNS